MADRRSFDEPTHVAPSAPGYAPRVERRAPTLAWKDAAGKHSVALGARQVIGSGAGVDVVVADPAVSRLHAEIESRDDGVWARDLGSKNGTFVDGVMVTGARVPEKGEVRVGATTMTVRYDTVTASVDLWPAEHFGPLIGQSVAMRELFARLARVAASPASALLAGETGTGKELVAKALHAASPRAAGPFVVVDCAALPENLLESELFGHAKGAFTGAVAARAGAFEQAEGGTVFLDEIGELPLAMQPKLLRVLESRTVRRLGEANHRAVDVRIVSATHRDLRTMVNQGAFREDLYFRLAVLPVTIPPLRAHPEDIPALVAHFLPAGASAVIRPETLRELRARPWLGNVRELRNFVERAVALGAHEALAMVSDAGPRAPGVATGALPTVPLDVPFKDLRDAWLEHLEREYLGGLLARHQGNVSAVAQAAGLDRTYVHRLLKKHDLDR